MMRIIRDTRYCPPDARGAVIALGNFDGVHIGHRAIIRRAVELAKQLGTHAAVMTFEPHPREFFAPDAPRLRMYSLRQKLSLLEEAGIKQVFLMRFNQALASTSASDFVEQILHRQLGARHVVTGYNFAFGKGRAGNTDMLAAHAKQHGFGFTACDPVTLDGNTVSSSAIRALLDAGNLTEATRMLGAPYRLHGRVRSGAARGRTIGYPTANIALDRLFKPKLGVYAVQARLPGGEWHHGIANIGVKPTFNLTTPMLEVHLFDFNQMIYGQKLEVMLNAFIRPEIRFASVDALLEQIRSDVEQAKRYLTKG
jgi:riboflavin kinase/FMN adenylyltransferase